MKILLLHGHQIVPWDNEAAFYQLYKEHQVDFIVTGHTHTAYLKKMNGFYILNPGSVTGAHTIDNL